MRTYRRRRKRKRRGIAEPVVKPANRPAKRKAWTEEQMAQAIECAKSGTASYNKAAELYGVPKSTLKDRLSGRVEVGCRPVLPSSLRRRGADFSFTQCVNDWTHIQSLLSL